MATTLNHLIPAHAPQLLGEHLARAGAGISPAALVKSAGPDFDALPLMARGQRLADALIRHLPSDFAQAAPLLVASMGAPMALDAQGEPVSAGDVPSGFFYLPHSLYIAQHGLDHLDLAMDAQHALTQRFTAEFSLRPYLQQHTGATLAHLARWAQDSNAHVRRAASEATRPRLPWAARLSDFVRDPSPALPLLQTLRDDPSSYVRRSVANHLNDIGKDHPELLLTLAGDWFAQAPAPRAGLLKHALRSLIKAGHPQALALLGHAGASALRVSSGATQPPQPFIGTSVRLQAELHNPSGNTASALADWRVHYVKADGQRSAKVFKGSTITLAAGERCVLEKTLSLRQMSTRTHYPGTHVVELALNGQAHAVAKFELLP
jgi:3-methyladenine DNA glycosylase AlkC